MMSSWLIPLSDEAMRAETAQHRARLIASRGTRRTTARGSRITAVLAAIRFERAARAVPAPPAPC